MSERDDNQLKERQAAHSPVLYILAAAFAAIAGFGSVTLSDFFARQPAPEARAAPAENTGGSLGIASTQDGKGGLGKLVYVDTPAPLPADIAFTDNDGVPRSLADYRGRIVLLNLWATWCAPCKVEMPSLSRLQAALGGADFVVVAVSLDRTGPEGPRKFLAAAKLDNLPLLMDATGGLANKIGASGLPATVLIDREGREMARLLGPAEWDGPAAQALIRGAIAGKIAR